MHEFQTFEQQLQEGLRYLYDARHTPPQLLCQVLGQSDNGSCHPVWRALAQAIRAMEPVDEIPCDAPIHRQYHLLSLRYLDGLTQETAAEELGITPRHLRREQKEAVRALAQRLWAASGRALPDQVGATPSDASVSELPELGDWRSQVEQELNTLQEKGLDQECELGGAIRSIRALVQGLTARAGVGVRLGEVDSDLQVAMPELALRQVLIAVVSQLANAMLTGVIDITAIDAGERVELRITGENAHTMDTFDNYLAQQLLSSYGGHLETIQRDKGVQVCIDLARADPVRVLVVDDNDSMVHFYRRYTAGTPYAIEHLARGAQLLSRLDQVSCDIVVLDVMLPDVDGWELLTCLHAHPATCDVPVIVCSVVTQPELALSLGATLYLPKPVRRQQFIEALDSMQSRALSNSEQRRRNSAIDR